MSSPHRKKPLRNSNMVKTIFLSALFVGTLDILMAIVLTLIRKNSPITMLQYIASGIYGNTAFTGGSSFAFLGLIIHYLIAFIWTILFFNLYPKIRSKVKSNILIGFFYGIIVWVTMNLIVLPLSNVPPTSQHINSIITAILILIAVVGIPLSFMARKYYGTRNEKSKK